MNRDRLDASRDIDRMTASEIVSIIQAEDRRVPDAVAAAGAKIAQAIDAIADRMKNGGRMFYVGAGTSGRIAMLDASELPPTYGISPDAVQVIMAGGPAAWFTAVEGAEDRETDAIDAVNTNVTPADSVIGIAASGRTPFTVAAIRRANMIGALTVGVTSAAGTPLAQEPDIPVVVNTGPEVIMGSTRMKSGTAQKLILNTISTGVMIRLGRVYSNLMVDMPATNAKLRERAVTMVEIAAGVTRPVAASTLAKADGEVKTAVVMLKNDVDAAEARQRLDAASGNLREVLGI